MRTSRRGFLGMSASSIAAASSIGVAANATAEAEPFKLTITEGERRMFDGTPVWFRGFQKTGSSHTAPELPGPFLGNPGPGVVEREIFEGDTVKVRLHNSTPREHTFVIDRNSAEQVTDPVVGPVAIPPGATREISFTAPTAGTYIYRDADRNNRILGMCGVMIVMPRGVGGRNFPYSPSPERLRIPAEVKRQYVWALHDIDPVLGELARNNWQQAKLDYPIERVLPRYFVINGQTGDSAIHDAERTVPVLPVQEDAGGVVGVLIRIVNTGIAAHQCHFHGNHVFVVQRGAKAEPANLVYERDVVRMEPLHRTAVILPAHTGYDAFPPIDRNHPKADNQNYPMHCHAEMSQTAGGGGYPFGMLTDWHLAGPDEESADEIERQLAERRAAHRRNQGVRQITSVPNR